jgi:hypothetical protein
MAITKFRITANKLEPRVHEAAKNSSNVVFIPPPVKESLAGAMLFQQVMACVRKGKIRGKPRLAKENYWEFRMDRYSAGRWFSCNVAAEVNDSQVVRLIVFREDEAK